MTTTKRFDLSSRIPYNHPVRDSFAGCSSGNNGANYYDTKGQAIDAFYKVLEPWGLWWDWNELMVLTGDDGWRVIPVYNSFGCLVGSAHLSWYRLPSGRYEFTGYLS
jgi:hypothetical protein